MQAVLSESQDFYARKLLCTNKACL